MVTSIGLNKQKPPNDPRQAVCHAFEPAHIRTAEATPSHAYNLGHAAERAGVGT